MNLLVSKQQFDDLFYFLYTICEPKISHIPKIKRQASTAKRKKDTFLQTISLSETAWLYIYSPTKRDQKFVQ